MHLISFDASPRQVSKLRNGHAVRIKRGKGFNLIVHPQNYSIVSRAFSKNKGVQLKLSDEEINANKGVTPELHAGLAEEQDKELFSAEGSGIFKSVKKALNSKEAKQIGRELRPVSRALKRAGKDYAHQKIAEAHMAGADYAGDNPLAQYAVNYGADYAHSKVERPREEYHGREYRGRGLGAGMNAHHALKLANLATAHANHELAKMHNATVHGQLTQPPIKRYWNEVGDPLSRGTGIRGDLNFIRGRGSLISHDSYLPPALQSQPFGANFHMQFFLPPEYHKYNDGTHSEGRGLYL